jgi:hypothetical protein
MVRVEFAKGRDHLLTLLVDAKGRVRADGDASWLRIESFQPHSERLGRPVSFHEEPEEWALSLPGAYAGSGLEVTASRGRSRRARPSGPRQRAVWALAACALVVALVIVLVTAHGRTGLRLAPGPAAVPPPQRPGASWTYLSRV